MAAPDHPFGLAFDPTAGIAVGWSKMAGVAPDGTPFTRHILIAHTATGLVGLSFTDDGLKRLLDAGRVALSGLHLPNGSG